MAFDASMSDVCADLAGLQALGGFGTALKGSLALVLGLAVDTLDGLVAGAIFDLPGLARTTILYCLELLNRLDNRLLLESSPRRPDAAVPP